MQKTIGSILIVAGTTIGAGMLAMPIISANVGFYTMALILCCIWFAMYYTSVLLVNVYKYNSLDDGLNTLTLKYLGKPGAIITALSMLSLMYALVSAYIAGGGEIIKTTLENLLGITVAPEFSGILFTVFFGGIICFGTRLVDISTKVTFSIKLLALCIVIGLFLPQIEAKNLQHFPTTALPVLATIPIIFTSFGFYVVIPSLVKYLEGDIKKLKTVFLIGSLIPLFLYLIWELTVLGNISANEFSQIVKDNSGLDGLLKAINQIKESRIVEIAFNVFAAAAILTSFWGVSLALKDYIKDLGKNTPLAKTPVLVILLTFFPPILFALFYPDGFITALGYASVSLVVLALLMPMLMLYRAKKEAGEKLSIFQILAYLYLIALAIIIIYLQFLTSIGAV